MRRLLYVTMIVGRFAGQSYVWRAASVRRPVPIVRNLDMSATSGTTLSWWLAK
jgi:hypothetical protein